MRYEMAPLAIESDRSERAAFIRRTYTHLAGAILAFTLLEVAFFMLIVPGLGLERTVAQYVSSPYMQLTVLVAFIAVGYLARYWARAGSSPQTQYLGLGLYIVLQAVIFVPILFFAQFYGGAAIITQAAILTLCLFGGLTATVFLTRKDFSFLGPILMIGSFILLGVIIIMVIGMLGGFDGFAGNWMLSMGISVFAVILAAGFILYDTSNVMLHFRTDQHVAAALDLFASVAFLFMHILNILMLSRR